MSNQLPGQGNYFSAAGARIREIKAIENQLVQCEHGLRAFQNLPRHMQRRAVSSNPQRLPLYLREKHKREVGNKVKQSKRPCRKYRRRPSNLLAAYSRRQRNVIWLETHIWHAKRFHMLKHWGYSLPKTPTSKSYRPSLRAATESCLVQDVSYECCFELGGAVAEISAGLASLLSTADALTLRCPRAQQGLQWVQATLFANKRFPFDAIGGAQMVWRSQGATKDGKLWLWVHASIYEQTLATLVETFSLKETEEEDKDKDKDKGASALRTAEPVLEAKISCRNVPGHRAPLYTSSSVRLRALKDTLGKLRLIGPRSYSLMTKVLAQSRVTATATVTETTDDDVDSGGKAEEEDAPPWWRGYYSEAARRDANAAQGARWDSFEASEPPCRAVVGLVARDPRALLPANKVPYEEDQDAKQEQSVAPPDESVASCSLPIFDDAIRDCATFNMKSNDAINTLRSKLMVPGTPLPLTEGESRLPVLLLHRPGPHVSKLGSGWDLVLPCGWSSQTLVSLVMHGAAVGGQDEEDAVTAEFLLPPNPHRLPDTTAGTAHAAAEARHAEEEFFRRPPNCRLNFIKLGVRFPFGVDWAELMRDWSPAGAGGGAFYVARDGALLGRLAAASCRKREKLRRRQSGKRKAASEGNPAPAKARKGDGGEEEEEEDSRFVNGSSLEAVKVKDALLYVRLVLLGKGTLEKFALICMPTHEDLEKPLKESGDCGVAEPAHEDTTAAHRVDLKKEHRTNLNHLRRKRRKAKDKVLCGKEDPLKDHSTMQDSLSAVLDTVKDRNKEMVEEVEAYSSKANKLWLPDRTEVAFQSCARKVFGFLTHGGFSLRMGRVGGLGYVAAEPLVEHMERSLKLLDGEHSSEEESSKQVLVLVRNPSSLQYRWARLVVLNI